MFGMIKYTLITITFGLLLSGCSHLNSTAPAHFDEHLLAREPSSDANSCQSIIKSFYLNDEYQVKLEKSLIDKKLLTRSNKFVTVNHPRLDWLNKTREGLITKVKNWNANRYPAFYIFHDSEIIENSKKFSSAIVKQSSKNKLSVEEKKHVDFVKSMLAKYKNYNTEIDNLLNERIVLEYNLNLVKKIKIKKDETKSITLSFLKDGKKFDQIFALSASDKDLDFLIKDLKAQIKSFDGTVLKNGKIKDRVIRQATLSDMIEIATKELEHSILNNPRRSDIAQRQLNEMKALLTDTQLSPKTYGVYRVTNAVFLRELASLSKLDVAYKKFLENPTLKVKEIFSNYIKSKDSNKTDAQKIGMFKKVYTKVTSISPRTAVIGGLGVAGVGVSSTAFFSIKEPIVTETEIEDGFIIHPELDLQGTGENVEEESQAYSQTINGVIELLITAK